MPLYEYQCKSCDHHVELLVRSPNDKPQCPGCGGDELDRLLSVPAAPSVKNGSSLPISSAAESCGLPRCCGGGCQM